MKVSKVLIDDEEVFMDHLGFVYGNDKSDRFCRIAQHQYMSPSRLKGDGGIYTSGHKYRLVNYECRTLVKDKYGDWQ